MECKELKQLTKWENDDNTSVEFKSTKHTLSFFKDTHLKCVGKFDYNLLLKFMMMIKKQKLKDDLNIGIYFDEKGDFLLAHSKNIVIAGKSREPNMVEREFKKPQKQVQKEIEEYLKNPEQFWVANEL